MSKVSLGMMFYIWISYFFHLKNYFHGIAINAKDGVPDEEIGYTEPN